MDDFGTGLRAHLGLEAGLHEPAAEAAEPEPAPVVAAVADEPAETEIDRLEALAALEAELHERERALALREAVLASRAGAILAAAQSLYDDVMGGGPSSHDELALLRQRKSMP